VDSASVAAAAAAAVLPEEMLVTAARQAGIDTRPDELAWLEQVTEELAIQELRRQEVLAQGDGEADEARRYYEAHPEAFLRPMRAHIVEVLVGTEEEARQVLADLERGELLEDVAAARTLRPASQQRGGIMVVDAHVRLEDARLHQAVSDAPMDQVVGPVPVAGGYSVFQVIHREGGDVLPFAEVEPTARLLARRERREDRLDELVDALWARLGDQVVVYEDELARALPDSLLASAAAPADSRPGSR